MILPGGKIKVEKKSKKYVLLCIIPTLCLTICIGGAAAKRSRTSDTIDKTFYGNQIDNIANGGMAVWDEATKTVFYSNQGIFAKPDQGEAYEVTDIDAQSLAIKDQKLFFCNLDDNNRCYSLSLNNGELQKLNDALSVEYLNIWKDKLYFVCPREIDKRGIYSMDLDGENLMRISDIYAGSLILYQEFFFFLNKEDGNCLYRMDMDGKNLQKLTDSQTYCPIISQENGRLYYSDTETICSCNLEGKARKKIVSFHANTLAFDNKGQLIFGSFDYSGRCINTGVYRINGENIEKIRDDEVLWLSSCKNNLYFKSLTQNLEVMRCDFDGKNGVYVAGNERDSMLAP